MTRGPRQSKAPRRDANTTRAGDRGFLEYVLDQLGRLRDVEARAMFGGHGLYQAGTFFGMVHRGRLYFRVSEASRSDYEEHGMKPFRPGPGQTLKNYREVPAAVLEDPTAVGCWAREAVKAVASSKGRRDA